MTSPSYDPYGGGFGGYGYDPGAASDFWGRAQASAERRWQDQLGESRAERANRLQIANNQLKAGRARIAVAQGQAEADRWYKEQQVRLASDELGLDRDKLALSAELGRGQLAQGWGELGLRQQQLGAETELGLLQLRSQLRGPGDWAQYLDLGEGMTSLQPSSGFLTAISQGKRPPGMDTLFGGQPTPASLQGLAGNTQQAQADRLRADLALATQIAGNVGKVHPATWGSLSPDRMDYLKGLWETGGHSARTLLDAAHRAGIGQSQSPWAY